MIQGALATTSAGTYTLINRRVDVQPNANQNTQANQPSATADARPGAPSADTPANPSSTASKTPPTSNASVQQSEEDAVIQQLRARDREVRAHEAAHSAAGGRYTGATSLEFQRGPDGVNYAVGGEVSIDISPVPNDPEATIEKARTIRAAALAPAQPSNQDRQVAAQAAQLEASARRELQQQQTEERQEQAERPATGYDAILADDRNPQSASRLIDYTV